MSHLDQEWFSSSIAQLPIRILGIPAKTCLKDRFFWPPTLAGKADFDFNSDGSTLGYASDFSESNFFKDWHKKPS